jgi:hypothetical protein
MVECSKRYSIKLASSKKRRRAASYTMKRDLAPPVFRLSNNALAVSVVLYALSILSFTVFMNSAVNAFLWFGVVVSFLAATLGITKARRETEKVLVVVLFLVSLRVLLMLSIPEYGFSVFTKDASYDMQLSSLIYETGKLEIGLTGSYWARDYAYYPMLHLLTAVFAKASGLELFFFARILFPLVAGSLTVVFYYLTMRTVVGQTVAATASFILLLDQNFIFFDHYVRESYALVFLVMVFYAIFQLAWVKARPRAAMACVGILAVIAVAAGHHFTSYNLVATLALFWVLPPVWSYFTNKLTGRNPNGHRFRLSSQLIVFFFCTVLAWSTLVALVLYSMHLEWSIEALRRILLAPSEPHFSFVYPRPLLEKETVYLGWAVLAGIGVSELFLGMRSRTRSSARILLEVWFIFSSLYLFIGSVMGGGWERWIRISNRIWTFSFLGISPLIAEGIARMAGISPGSLTHRKSLKLVIRQSSPLLLLLPLLSATILAGPLIENPTLVQKQSHYDWYMVAGWTRERLPINTIAADMFLGQVIYAYGVKDPAFVEGGLLWFQNSTFVRMVYPAQTGSVGSWQALAFNKRISEWYGYAIADPTALLPYYNVVCDSGSTAIYLRLQAMNSSAGART